VIEGGVEHAGKLESNAFCCPDDRFTELVNRECIVASPLVYEAGPSLTNPRDLKAVSEHQSTLFFVIANVSAIADM